MIQQLSSHRKEEKKTEAKMAANRDVKAKKGESFVCLFILLSTVNIKIYNIIHRHSHNVCTRLPKI